MIIALLFLSFVTFDDLPRLKGASTPCEIHGFLYRSQEDEVILAEKPKLKSCCIKKGEPIICLGDFEKLPTSLASLEGVLTYENDHFILKDAKLIKQKRFPWKTVSFALLMIPLIYWLRRSFSHIVGA